MKFTEEKKEGVQQFARELAAVVTHINNMAQTGKEDENLAVLHFSATSHNCEKCEETECEMHGKKDETNGRATMAGVIGSDADLVRLVASVSGKDPNIFRILLRGIQLAAKHNQGLELLMKLEEILQ